MKSHKLNRLLLIDEREIEQKISTDPQSTLDGFKLSHLSNRYGKAGYNTEKESKEFKVKYLKYSLLSLCVLLLFLALICKDIPSIFLGLAVALYIIISSFFLLLRLKAKRQERLILFQTPLVLEALIQLVEAGMGILPAIHHVVNANKYDLKNNTPKKILKLVYDISASGIPFGQALQRVAFAIENKILRHVLIHLDISGNEGGELIPSLRSLSNHSQLAWKLSVQQRVKRLENLVIFPVFISVLGLLCLSASVPLYPILDFMNNQKQAKIASLN